MIIFDIFVAVFITAVFVFMALAFDGLILSGVFQRKLKRWAENKFENDNKDK
jgi:ABC-type Fe3+-siderophore transport system permease subunit